MRRLIALAAALPLILIGAPAIADQATDTQALSHALATTARAGDSARDQYRHPAETLAFFQVRPGMTVADYMPSGGWYTRILVPYLGPQGRYIALNPDPAKADNSQFRDYAAALDGKFAAAYPGWKLAGAPVTTFVDAAAVDELDGTLDRVLIFREMHNIHRNGLMHAELDRIHALLKDDGMLGIVQHRAKPSAPASYTDGSNGYLRQKDVIGLVEAHGFDLVDTSEINANPRDTADHPKGVWELPPVLGSKRDELKAVGESDRMTLLFRKRV